MNQQLIRPSTVDWTEDAVLHRRYLDWEEEVKLLMEGPLSGGGKKPAPIKVNYLLIWIGQQVRDQCKTIHPDNSGWRSYKDILDKLQKWTKPKSNQITVFTTLKEFKQGTLSLSQYINEVTRLVHACNYGTETNRLPHDIIV